MKNLLAILAVAILGSMFALAATGTATNTVTLDVDCPTPAVTVSGGNTYAQTAIAGTDVASFPMTWAIVGNGQLPLSSPTVAITTANPVGNCTLVLGAASVSTWSGNECNATATGSSSATITVPANAIASPATPYSWTVSYTITY